MIVNIKKINILTRFHKDWMKTVTSTVYTNKLLTDAHMHDGRRTSHGHISSLCHFVTVLTLLWLLVAALLALLVAAMLLLPVAAQLPLLVAAMLPQLVLAVLLQLVRAMLPLLVLAMSIIGGGTLSRDNENAPQGEGYSVRVWWSFVR
ncbi:hypothetical protein DPMN_070100 [Dreissena polymorpha]|uniref:Uncharacterized protein n=1 Tax=Dreissena polymorpha TaxID=45954 RepID=A0A9D4BNM9_DREPO|nr:hypothetical protein DPMN_070100 [Dreissena polymorpha]